MSKTMNLWVYSIFVCLMLVQIHTVVIPIKNDNTTIEHPANMTTLQKSNQNKQTTIKATSTVKLTTTTPRKSIKIEAKPMPKDDTDIKNLEVDKPKVDNPKVDKPQDVDLLAGPVEPEKKKDYGKIDESSANRSVLHFILIVVGIVGCCCIATTYRKKLMGYCIGFRRTRRSGNVRYRRLSTGEATIE